MKKSASLLFLLSFLALPPMPVRGQQNVASRSSQNGIAVRKLPDTGQTTSYTSTVGEDADYIINAPSYTVNGDATVLDTITGLMWQKGDAGDMTVDAAAAYCDSLTLGGHADWRLPSAFELYGILNHDHVNPAFDTGVFPKTAAEYWWTADRRADDSSRVWVANAGGGIGPHPKSECMSAGGTKRFHVRAVRSTGTVQTLGTRFRDNGDGTVSDLSTKLMWQQSPAQNTMTWEQALSYAEASTLASHSDWRLPNIKELQSLNDVRVTNPSIDRSVFPSVSAAKFWSSTSQVNATGNAWYMDCQYGITTYEAKTKTLAVLAVRTGTSTPVNTAAEALIPAGVYEMGDHFGFVDPAHPSDEVPIHTVHVDSFYLAKTLATNEQFLAFLNAVLLDGAIDLRNNAVYLKGDTNALYLTYQYSAYYSIGYAGNAFSLEDFRATHPVVGVLWCGAAAFCNWLSARDGRNACYNLKTWDCDFAKNGYRLPTEAEWEWAGRGGHINPYFNYPFGNSIDVTKANLPASGDPYETGPLPNTTPVGFYDGTVKKKADYNWPGAMATYQTGNGANDFGLYDMQGNVWEFVNDWYGQNYYSASPYNNPTGPASGFLMPDGKPYRGVRGGNWYNGLVTNGVNDGHSRVSNRNPSYYRGPCDANAPWHHTGFRIARKYDGTATGVDRAQDAAPAGFRLYQNYPNPFNPATTIRCSLERPARVTIRICDALGREVTTLADRVLEAGDHAFPFDGAARASGVYYCRMQAGTAHATISMHLIK